MATSVMMSGPLDIPLDVAPGVDPFRRTLPEDLSDPARAGAALDALIESHCLDLPLPAAGATAARWRALADIAVRDVTLARLAESHARAAAILADLGGPAPQRNQRWAVWVTGDPADALVASWTSDGWTLHGTRSSCSGARVYTHALVAAEIVDEEVDELPVRSAAQACPALHQQPRSRLWPAGVAQGRPGHCQLFAVRLDDRGVSVAPASPGARPTTGWDTATVLFDGASAAPLGVSRLAVDHPAPGMSYPGPMLGGTVHPFGETARPAFGETTRPEVTFMDDPSFWNAATDAAACWFGGAIGVARTLFAAGRSQPPDGPGWTGCPARRGGRAGDAASLAQLGRVDVMLMSGRCVLEAAAREMDADPEDATRAARKRALRVRAIIEAIGAEVIDRVERALGPGLLCADRGYAQRVADLNFYLRQAHANQDLTALAAVILDEMDPPWW